MERTYLVVSKPVPIPARLVLLTLLWGLAWTHPAAAQPASVTGVLQFLVTNQSVATGDFERDRAAAERTSDTIGRALLASLATLPVSSSSSAFVYRLNPALGTVERATTSFGPLFTERALTAGRGAISVGLTLQHFRFMRLAGRPLRDGTLITTANQFVDEPAPFDEDRLSLHVDADVTTLYGSVGVTDRLEVGAALPVVALRVDGTRVNTYRGRTFTQATASATTFGVADAVVRAKLALLQHGGNGLATAVDLRFPTGRKEDLLGTGRLSTRLSLIGSAESGRVSVHANGGWTTGGLARELSAAAALAIVAGRRTTFVGEMQARRLDLPGDITTLAVAHPTLAGVRTLRLVPQGAALTTLTVSPGVKWNVGGSWVAIANVTLPLLQHGLTSPVTPFVGLDWLSGR